MNLKFLSEKNNRFNSLNDLVRQITDRIPQNKRKIIIVLLAIALLIIILVPGGSHVEKKDNNKAEINDDSEYTKQLENELCDLISSIEGAGKTKVFLTLESTDENIYAKDIKEEKSEYVVIKNESNQGGMLLKIKKPIVKGVAVVCEGGDKSSVKIEIINAISSSLGVSSTRISISKMKNRSD